MIARATQVQIQIAKDLGIEVSKDSFRVAAARILDLVAPAIGYNAKPATSKQVEFAKGLGIDVTSDSSRVASARIQDKLEEVNSRALKELRLAPGDKVVVRKTYTFSGQEYMDEREYVVSSIKDNGMVYFKGGNGKCAWACKVQKIK